MDALLPSEVARLVLGYLQEQKCEEAAKVFMETSPLLQEVNVVAKKGGRYSTRVGGSSLADILDKYCSVNAIVQDKLGKISDSEQLKQCNDLLDQLRYLLDGPTRSHKFVVNINMPQSSPAAPFGSPSLTGSSRKRHHSNSERSKRAARSLNTALEKSAENSEQRNCDNVETISLESESHKNVSTRPNLNSQNLVSKASETSNGLDDISSSAKENGNSVSTTHPDLHSTTPNLSNNDYQSHRNFESEPTSRKCTAETSTEELMTYSSTEVQTGPCDFFDFESEINDDPIQNLTIITKELMQRSELTERIAENINKSIIPVESREENPNESVGDANKSLLTDFDNAIKSVVEATNTDPVFEGFLKEIFAVSEPEEDSDGRQNKAPHTNNAQVPMEVDEGTFGSDKRNALDRPMNESDVPLKQRLRSGSLRSHTINLDEEKENNSTLEDQNAEAIMNIVNVIASKRNSLTLENEPIIIDPSLSNDHPVDPVETDPLAGVPPDHGAEDEKVENVEKLTKTKRARKPRKTTRKKPVPVEEEVPTVPTLILCSEEDALARGLDGAYRPIAPKPGEIVPDSSAPSQRKIVLRTVNVPRHLLTPSQIELLQVPQSSPLKVPQLTQPSPLKLPSKVVLGPGSAVKHQPQESITLYGSGSSPATSSLNGTPSAELRVSSISSMPIINLDEAVVSLAAGSGLSPYFKISTGGNGPSLSLSPVENELDAAPTLAASNDSADATDGSDGTNIVIHEEKPSIEPVEQPPPPPPDPTSSQANESVKIEAEARPRTISSSGDGIIAKRTPRSLLRSRSKNNRLSLSTPRRRRSHVRALDFGTPAKFGGAGAPTAQSARKLTHHQRHKLNESRGSSSRSVRRAGLFGSPPFSEPELESTRSARAVPSESESQPEPEEPPPPPPPRRVPIATRSPAPKLQANWNKISGIGLIIGSGDSSASETSADCFSSPEKQPKRPKQQQNPPTPQAPASPTPIAPASAPKSWDSDLRKIVGPGPDEPEESRARPRSARKPRRKIVGGLERLQQQQPQPIQQPVQQQQQPQPIQQPKQQQPHLVLDLETPRKMELAMVPATPCVILNTPGDSLIRTCYSKPSTCLSIKDCAVVTPDFPVTPCIVLTPKFINDEDLANRKPSPYYEPDPQQPPKTVVEEIVLEATATTTTTTVAKLTIKKDASEQQKIELQPTERPKSVEIVSVIENDSGDESSDSDSSSSSGSSSNSSSSSSSSKSSTSRSRRSSRADDSLPSSPVHAESVELALDSSSANTSANNSANTSASSIGTHPSQQQTNETEQTPEERVQQSDRQKADFLSPTSGKASGGGGVSEEPVEMVKETPAKMLVDEEAIISDTPSVSEAERAARRDSLTGLSSKMTAIIGASQLTTASDRLVRTENTGESVKGVSSSPTKDDNQTNHAVKPKIVDIQKLAPGDGVTLQLSKMMQSDSQKLKPLSVLKDNEAAETSKVNFSLQLEEKRQRLVAKLKQTNTKAPAKKTMEEGKQKRNGPAKKATDTDKVVSSTSDQIEKPEKQIDAKESRDPKSGKASTNASDQTESRSNELQTEITGKVGASKTASSPSKKVLRAHASKDQDAKNRTLDVTKKGDSSTKKAMKECSSASSSSSSSSRSTAVATTVTSATTAGASVHHIKDISKSRVDQVKRDLFSDEEVNDQRTTRSQTARQTTVDGQKKELDKTGTETIPGVLECLELRPANKSDLEIEKENEVDDYGFRDNSATEVNDIFCIYDESVPIKKRKRQYSSSELQSEYGIQFPDETVILRVTEEEELYKIAPIISKKKISCLKKKQSSKKHREKSSDSPAATPSPVAKASKKSRSHDKKKSCKRKHSPLKENKMEKKSKVDAQALFNKIKIDEFLRAVHVPGK